MLGCGTLFAEKVKGWADTFSFSLENIATLIPATHQMVSRAGIFNSQRSGHAEKVDLQTKGINLDSKIHRLTPFWLTLFLQNAPFFDSIRLTKYLFHLANSHR